jgi:NAD(P)-dependent dehydrogenase (short-subunit alcohol dehydrogenase family)
VAARVAPPVGIIATVDTLRFDHQVVIVTGAGRGLGRLYALDFAERGAAVVVNDVGASVDGTGSDPSVADGVVAEIQGRGGRAAASHETIGTVDGARRVVEMALDLFGRLDVVVNNAGNIRQGLFGEISSTDLDAILQVHIHGAFNITQPAFLVMRDQGYGRIVFTGSSAGAFGSPGLGAYAAGKGGILGLARVVALEGASDGVLANTVLPTGRTRMAGASPVVYDKEAPVLSPARRAFLDSIKPQFVSPLVTYLSSPECAVTGQVFSAVGKRYARVFMGLARGWVAGGAQPTAEDVRDHFGEINDPTGFLIPESTAAEVTAAMEQLAGDLGPATV